MAAAYEPPVSDDRGPLIIRPSWGALGRWQIYVVLAMGLGLGLGGLRLSANYHTWAWVVALIGSVGLFAVYGLYQALYMVGSRITVTSDSIVVTHWFRSTARVACRDIARVVRISLASSVRDAFARPGVFAFSANGRCVLSFYAERWSKTDLDRIWHQLGLRPEGSWDRTILKQDLSVEFPGAF